MARLEVRQLCLTALPQSLNSTRLESVSPSPHLYLVLLSIVG